MSSPDTEDHRLLAGLPRDAGQLSAVLVAEGLSKRYRGRAQWALRHVNLEIPSGKLTALVGPNGAGKSTLIRTWMGFETPTEGSASVLGRDPRNDRAALHDIGYVPQGSALYRSLSVSDHIDFARVYRPRFDPAAVLTRLRDLRIPTDVPVAQLSGGQQAQVSLALAMGSGAPLLVLDEPLASLDPLARREFMRVLRRVVSDDGRTAILSSHVVSDIEVACDRLVILTDGTIQLDLAIRDALSSHSVIDAGDPPSSGAIGRIPALAGSDRVLVQRGIESRGSPATLEDIVMGYLAASQERAVRANETES